eukprot:gene15227-biopygen9226
MDLGVALNTAGLQQSHVVQTQRLEAMPALFEDKHIRILRDFFNLWRISALVLQARKAREMKTGTCDNGETRSSATVAHSSSSVTDGVGVVDAAGARYSRQNRHRHQPTMRGRQRDRRHRHDADTAAE